MCGRLRVGKEIFTSQAWSVQPCVRPVFPNKPIRYVVNTHNHFDHLGGIRTYVAEGATVVTEDGNKDFYQKVVLAPQPRTLLLTGCRNGRFRPRALVS
jgi:glyoxylase-like metal-dependent hydrolase (beta-lactamase superfamily II)